MRGNTAGVRGTCTSRNPVRVYVPLVGVPSGGRPVDLSGTLSTRRRFATCLRPMSVGFRQIRAVKYCVRRSVQVDHYKILRTPLKVSKFDFLICGYSKTGCYYLTYPGKILVHSLYTQLCRCSHIFDPKIDLQKVRKRSKVLIRRVSF
jgi:hypothetical protein